MKTNLSKFGLAFALALPGCAETALVAGSSAVSNTVPVTADNFIRAETDMVYTGLVAQGGFGKFRHYRELVPIENHTVQRGNRDTLYSMGVFDLNAGPVTITLPDAGKRYLTMLVIDEDHYAVDVFYGAGAHTLTKAKAGTRYGLAALRILVDPNDLKDVAVVNALQDAVNPNISLKKSAIVISGPRLWVYDQYKRPRLHWDSLYS